ncbi:uncharacterized protein METZ01_LOCUS328722, partial [marine metagenome]
MDSATAISRDERKIPEVPLTQLETLWMQVGGTLC